jgi:hypothetical protein
VKVLKAHDDCLDTIRTKEVVGLMVDSMVDGDIITIQRQKADLTKVLLIGEKE